MDGLVWSDDLNDEAERVRADVAATLAGLGIAGEVELTGGLSVPGALTKGDVDLHLRVRPETFGEVVETLRAALPVASPGAWAATLAVFDVPGPRPTGLAVTPIGSEHDTRFRVVWTVLRRDPALLADYNMLKADSTDAEDYEERKSLFFTSVVATVPHERA